MSLVSVFIPYYYMKAKFIISLLSITSMLLSIEAGARENTRNAYPDTAIPADMSQQDNVTGKVTDENGDPLVGVMVYIEGTTIGVSTDLDGNYSIKAPGPGESYTLIYQYIGTVTQEIVVSKQRKINVTLLNDNELDEAMIVGAYGTRQRREDLVGSAYQVNAEALKNKPKARIDELLSGMIPGLTIEPNTDSAQSTRNRNEIRIRGEASLSASNEPLWVVDGVPYYTGGRTNQIPGMSYTISPLSFLDPNDIESITVLKDADQTTIYGANGSNGVVLVTTKSGKKNVPLSFNAMVNFGVGSPDKSTMFKTMNAAQFLEVAKESWTNGGNPLTTFPFQDSEYNSYSTTDTDWYDEYIGIGTNLYANVSMTSGTDKMSSYISASFLQQNSEVKTDTQQRVTFRSRHDVDLTRWLHFSATLAASYNNNNLFPLYRSYIGMLPILEPYMDDGTYRLYNNVFDGEQFTLKKFTSNQIPEREENTNKQRSIVTSGNFYLSATILKGLDVSTQFAMDYTHSHEDLYTSRQTLDGIDSDTGEPQGYSRRADASYMTWTSISRIDFNRKFGKHGVNAFAGLQLNQQQNKNVYATGRGFMNDSIQEVGYSDSDTRTAYSNSDTERSMSMFARAVYSYDSRYYISANFRRDGDSDFGKYARWDNFWSVGASWNIHNENFFQSDIIRMLKLKASYGITGNSRLDSSAAGTYTYGPSYSYAGVSGAVVSEVPNPGLTWEHTRSTNVGARIELKNIIDFEVEYYRKTTYDLLSKIYVSRTLSSDSIDANVGRVRNAGFEIDITSYNFNRKDFSWITRLNFSHNENKILELYNGVPRSFGSTVWMQGYDSNVWYLVEWAGVDPSDGMPMWYDLNGNVTKTYNSANRKPGKSRSPFATGGMINTFRYKNWELSFQINYMIGGWTMPTYASIFMNDGRSVTDYDGNEAIEIYYGRWTTPGQLSAYPKVTVLSTNSTMNSTRYLYNRTHFSLSNIVLAYSFPERLTRQMRLTGMTISLIGDNVYLFTPDQKAGWNSYKTMIYGYPVTRTFSISVTASF